MPVPANKKSNKSLDDGVHLLRRPISESELIISAVISSYLAIVTNRPKPGRRGQICPFQTAHQLYFYVITAVDPMGVTGDLHHYSYASMCPGSLQQLSHKSCENFTPFISLV